MSFDKMFDLTARVFFHFYNMSFDEIFDLTAGLYFHFL